MSSDCINRLDAIAAIREYAHQCIEKGKQSLDPVDDIVEMVCRMNDIPEADTQQHGRWKQRGYACREMELVCSCCGRPEWNTVKKPYCPNCGAKMDGGETDAKA